MPDFVITLTEVVDLIFMGLLVVVGLVALVVGLLWTWIKTWKDKRNNHAQVQEMRRRRRE